MARSAGDVDTGWGGGFNQMVYEVETGTRFDLGFNETAGKGKFFAILIGCYPWLIAALSTSIYAPLFLR